MRKVENIMQEFENIVIKCCQEVVSENHSDIEVDMDICLTNELGFDSLGIVSLVLLLEEKLEMDLDEYLMEIRNSNNVAQLIQAICRARINEL